jgi:hypothetical protein
LHALSPINYMEEGVSHGAGRLPALCRILCKGAVDDVAHRLRNVMHALAQRNGGLLENGPYRVVDTAAFAEVKGQ